MFSGAYERQLDERGRLALPAPFRSSLGERCMVFLGEDGCVGVRSASSYESDVADLAERVKRGDVGRDVLRRTTYSAVEVTTDKQGRIPIEARLRQHLGVDAQQPVVVAGAFDMLEIWAVPEYEQRYASLVGAGTGPAATTDTGPAGR